MVGTVALLITIIGMGSQSVPIKLPAVVNSRMSPFAVIMCFSLGALVAGLFLLPAVAVAEAFSSPQMRSDAVVSSDGVNLVFNMDTPEVSLMQLLGSVVWQGRWGMAAACFYAPGKILQLWSVRRIGVGLSTGVIASVNSVTAFAFVGVLVLGDLPSDMGMATGGIVLLLLGALGMTVSKSNETKQQSSATSSDSSGISCVSVNVSSPHSQLVRRNSSRISSAAAAAVVVSLDGSESASNVCSSPSFDWPGVIAAMISGICLGLQSLPFRYGSESGGSNSSLTPYATAAVFLIAQAPITLLLLACTTGFGGVRTVGNESESESAARNGDDDTSSFLPSTSTTTASSSSPCKAKAILAPFWSDVEIQVPYDVNAVVLSMVGGIVFSFAAVGQVISIASFGATVGMPLTQLNLIVAGVWGICFFGEIQQRRNAAMFFVFAALALTGGLLLHG